MNMTSLVEQGKQAFMNTYKQFPIVFDHGEDVYLVDIEGNKYLDFVAGIAVNALGYSNNTLKQALNEQINQFLHCSNLYWNEPAIKAASKLVELSGLSKVFFCNSGAESVEAALKLARKYAKQSHENKVEIIAMKDSFHGRTFGAISATGQQKYQKGLDPLLPGIKYCEYNNIDSLKALMNENTCAVLMEPIQGEGGIIPSNKDYIKEVRALCDANDSVLIFDEVQCGIGRTGELFAYQYYDVQPDIVCLAKGLGAGVPVGAIIANSKVASGFEPGDHASTFGGNGLAARAVNVVLDELMNKDVLANVKQQGAYLQIKLLGLKAKYKCITGVRGIGLMQGIALEGVPVMNVIKKCMDNGLLLVGAGSNVVRFVPPLVVKQNHIDEAMEILEQVLELESLLLK